MATMAMKMRTRQCSPVLSDTTMLVVVARLAMSFSYWLVISSKAGSAARNTFSDK